MMENKPISAPQGLRDTLWVPWVICGATLVVVCFFLLIFFPDSLWENWRGFVSKNVLKSDYVSVDDQSIIETFLVKSLKLSKPGFIEVRYGDWFMSPGDAEIGHSLLLPAGEYKNVLIDLNLPLHMRDQEPWQSIGYVILYYDNGDGEFNLRNDNVARDKLGDMIGVKTMIAL